MSHALSMSTGHSGATRISFRRVELWERAPRYYGPLFLLKLNRTWKHFPTYAASNLTVLRMGRLHIYSFSRGPLRKVDVAKGPFWQQFHLEAL